MSAKPWRPENAGQAAWFDDAFCSRCLEDRGFRDGDGDSCPIAAGIWPFQVTDPKYPRQVVSDESGDNPRCTAFVEDIGQEPPIRNVSTIRLTA